MKFCESLPRLGVEVRLFRGDCVRPPASTVSTRRWSAPAIASRTFATLHILWHPLPRPVPPALPQ